MTIWISFLASGLVLLCAAAIQARGVGRGGATALRPAGMDLLAKSFLDLLPTSRAPLLAFLIWAAVSVAVDVGGPLLMGRTDVLDSRLQQALFVNYCVLAPALLAAYLHLASVVGAASSRGRPLAFSALQIFICALAFLSQYSTILVQTSPDTATPPVLWADPGAWRLNAAGAAHAALRGLDAAMGLGLVCTMAGLWANRRALRAGPDSNGGRSRLRGALVAAIGVASAMLWVHFVTILMHRAEVQPTPSAFAQFVGSGWALWALAWALAVAGAAGLFAGAARGAKT